MAAMWISTIPHANSRRIPLLCAALALFSLSLEASNIGAYDLRVENVRLGQIDPSTIYVTEQARLAWKLAANPGSPTNGTFRQRAYRIVAATTLQNFESGTYDAWDTGVVQSNNTLFVPYNGSGLELVGSRVWWSVEVFDASGGPAALPPPVSITRAPTTQSDWRNATWIAATNNIPTEDCDFYLPDPTPLLRKEFTTTAAPSTAHLFITGLGFYTATINGVPVSDAVLDPAWTTYNKRTLFSAFDVTTLVQSGANVIGIVLGKGWYDPLPMKLFGAFDIRDALPVGTTKALALLVMTDAAGQTTTITTDLSWKVGQGAITRNNLYLGVQYDARIQAKLNGWMLPGYNTTGWATPVVANVGNIGPLELQTLPLIRVTSTYPATSVTPISGSPSSFTVTFPVNMAGLVQLQGVNAPAGWTINMTFAEIIFENGTINSVTNWAGAIGRYSGDFGPCAPVPAYERNEIILAGTGNESFLPQFTWHAFRYMQIDNWPVETHGPPNTDNFVALQFHTDSDPAGLYASSNAMFPAIDEMARQSFRSNWAGGQQSDCPGRERLGYGGDLMVSAEAAMLQYDVHNLYAKRVNDYADAAQDNGGLPETAPFIGIETCDTIGNGTGPMQWGSGHSQLQLEMYAYYGDKQILIDNYPTVQRWIALLNASAQDYYLTNGLNDFTQTGCGCTCDLMTMMGTVFFYQQAGNAAQIARILGHADDVAMYTQLGSSILAAFQSRFVDAGTGVIGTGTLDESLWALYLGAVPSSALNTSLDYAYTGMHVNLSDHLFTGAFGTSFVLRGGPSWGWSDMLHTALNQVDYPGYGYMLANGATSLYEHWQALQEIVSFNHAWLGSVAAFFRRYSGGISHAPDAVGFDKVVIQPYLPPLNFTGGNTIWSNTTYESIRGTISVNWTLTLLANASITTELNVNLPPNVQCTVYVPHSKPGGNVLDRAACAAAGQFQPDASGAYDTYNLDYFAGTCAFSVTQ